MNRNLTIAAGLLAIIFVGYLFMQMPLSRQSESVSSGADQEIRALVTQFGEKLKMVPLVTSISERTALMQRYYSRFVSPELLAQWGKEGTGALGRHAPSPVPARVDVDEVRSVGAKYIVEANVIEVTKTEAGEEPAGVQPITLELEKRNDQWLIVKMTKGAYSELPQRKTIVGFWECLPHKDQSGPQTMECAFGIAVDKSDGHYAVDTHLMSTYPVDFPTGTKVRAEGVITPADQLNSIQKYDIDGIISATKIEKI